MREGVKEVGSEGGSGGGREGERNKTLVSLKLMK